MRSTPLWLGLICTVSSVCTFVLSGCTSDTTPIVYIGMAYEIGCIDCQDRLPEGLVHDIRAVDGEAGYNLDCAVTTNGGTRRVRFTAAHESSDTADNYLIHVEDGRLDAEESDGPCEVRLVEGNNSFTGGCGSDEPTEERPCQVSFELKGDVVKGGIYCRQISGDSKLLTSYLAAPDTQTDPAEFELYGCRGL